MQTLALQDCMMEHKDYYKDFIGLADGAEGGDCFAYCNKAVATVLDGMLALRVNLAWQWMIYHIASI